MLREEIVELVHSSFKKYFEENEIEFYISTRTYEGNYPKITYTNYWFDSVLVDIVMEDYGFRISTRNYSARGNEDNLDFFYGKDHDYEEAIRLGIQKADSIRRSK